MHSARLGMTSINLRPNDPTESSINEENQHIISS
jgi:hypothetical protein